MAMETAALQFPVSSRLAEQRLEELDCALNLSQAMAELIRVGDWTELSALQARRDQLLRKALSVQMPDNYVKEATEKVQMLLAQNDRLVNSICEVKIALGVEFTVQRAKAQAAKKYLNQAR